jgi:hypothetical protein
MANFIQGNFVNPVAPGDTQVQIKDRFGRIRYTIAPHNVTAVFFKNNLIHVKTLGTDSVILIDFDNFEFAKKALFELQSQIDIAKQAPGLQIDPAITSFIENYINQVLSTSGLSSAFHQISATTSWGFTHSLTFVPNVTVTDDSLQEIEGLIAYITNGVTVNFNQSLTGWIFLS